MNDKKTLFIRYEPHRIICLNRWVSPNLEVIEKEFSQFQFDSLKSVVMDLSSIVECDLNAAVLIHLLRRQLESRGVSVRLVLVPDRISKLLAITAFDPTIFESSQKRNNLFFEGIGRSFYRIFLDIKAYFYFIGQLTSTCFYTLRHPFSLRLKELSFSIQEHAINALPIVLMTSLLIGLVIAYQSALQIRQYGADIFIVDMLVISITRELAPLITAIVIAGRSGSAYTAHLGAMKITEEIDVMRTMGFDPFRFLVLPNILALMIALPMMIFLADIVGVVGGMLAARAELNITAMEFMRRLTDIFELKHLFVGLIKGPFFAFIIASIGTMQGMNVINSTQSIGKKTTASVVAAIFMVIMCDALFSIVFLELGI
jgi:phospholipid/cholesterol/gamma-HCH transport system permease protein